MADLYLVVARVLTEFASHWPSLLIFLNWILDSAVATRTHVYHARGPFDQLLMLPTNIDQWSHQQASQVRVVVQDVDVFLRRNTNHVFCHLLFNNF